MRSAEIIKRLKKEGWFLHHVKGDHFQFIAERRKNPDYADGVWAMVDVELSKISGKIRRVNVTLPASLLEEVDDRARKTGESRSGLLAHAVMEYLSEGNGR
ncbi:MAG: type II toxin-antitoxin system HicB family antitoxin [Nitrospinae bacterium]|nr:type II toxin-antitoxin system HicB family antitoxin [Nitrospinota bacterium]